METNDEGVFNMWRVEVGTLQGFGEAAWERFGDKVRKIVTIFPAPTGQIIMQKPLCVNLMDGQETNEFASSIVIVGKAPRKEFIEDFKRLWSGSRILVPGNGPGPQVPRR